MINHTNNGHTISFPASIAEHDNKLAMVNLARIERLYEAMEKNYPVKIENLPVLESTPIQSETLPSTYAVCTEDYFHNYIQELKDSVDLITINDLLIHNKIQIYTFEV